MTTHGVTALTLVTGPEDVLVERVVADVVARARASGADVVRLDAATYEPGALAVHASPSLFGGTTCLVVRDLHEAPDELQADLLALLDHPSGDVLLVVTHGTGPRGKKVLDALRRRGADVVQCPAVKSDRDKSDFVQREFAAARRTITGEGVRALIEAVGRDVRELASACAQLVADTEGVVDEAVVDTYHGGKVEATGFRVADAAVAGQTSDALRLLRHAIATGVDPVPIVAVLAGQLRQLIKVAAAGRGSSAQLASSLGMAPWQVDRARRVVGHWSAEGLAVAVQAVAAADFEIKGGGRDQVFALERAVLSVARARSLR
ncbi:MAG TPA: DNA polymerase III subunit delta [Intrasporangium sp.]|uniref:DNA polymerase III subunit delta n=1 Tax=Intrasporangium sp. TaxID=1925024 RepID=UPI002D7936B0|nr:DNA polymerase III subunit delta [Intrasporangium sp.]HET7397309.1 DNA polymerase III subunit delta [Intrasporangium sp.]